MPEAFPDLRTHLQEWSGLSYPIFVITFFQKFATDLEDAELKDAIYSAYSGFSHSETAPLVRLNEHWQVLELFHGPTLAFKDFALQLLGNLYELQIKRTGKRSVFWEQPLVIPGQQRFQDYWVSQESKFLSFTLTVKYLLYRKGK